MDMLYIYIYIERERCLSIVYIYIYIYIIIIISSSSRSSRGSSLIISTITGGRPGCMPLPSAAEPSVHKVCDPPPVYYY